MNRTGLNCLGPRCKAATLRGLLVACFVLALVAVPGVGVVSPGAALAQSATQSDTSASTSTVPLSEEDYTQWQAVANRAEDAIQTNRASDTALESLRTELVDWRARFAANHTDTTAAARAVQAQLDTLGPAPAEGEEEAPEVAEQRASLNDKLAEIQAPSRRAELAHSQADALVRSVDGMLRARQTDAMLELGPAPIDPTKWPAAITDLTSYFVQMVEEPRDAWANQGKRAAFMKNLPVLLGLLALALLLVLRGRSWFERLAFRLVAKERTAVRWLISFVVSLGQIIIPTVGALMISSAIMASGIGGTAIEALATVLPAAGFQLFFARWLGNNIFPMSDSGELPLELSAAQRREGRLYALFFGGLLAADTLLNAAGEAAAWSDATHNVLHFPIVVLVGLFLLRISRFIVVHARSDDSESEDRSFRRHLIILLARLVSIMAIVGPLLAAVGYFKVGSAISLQTLKSLMLISLLIGIQKLIEEIYVLITRDRAGVAESLWPVLAGFAVTLLSLPVFALIWGARVTDLAELWSEFKGGFSLGDTHISPGDFVTFVIVFALCYALTRVVQGTLKTTVLPKTKLDIGGQNAVVSGLGYIGIFLAALAAITTAGIDLSSLAIVAGALSVGVGFGLRTIVENFVSGIILLVERPISEGDWIEAGGQMGFVRNISVRSTRIETFDRTDVIVPNADLISGVVTNWTRGNMIGRLIVKVGVAYGNDTRRVQDILQEIAEAQPLVLLNPPPGIIFNGFGADSLDFEMRMILRDITQVLVVQTEVNHQIAERFKEEGIEIPFAQRDIWLRNPEALLQGKPGVAAPAPGADDTQGAETPVEHKDQSPGPGRAPAHMRDRNPDDAPEADGTGEGDADR
ncbi:mechanosensitive ion channel family protein [Pseudooceanicola sediminis]|uniref:Mechanosensitive ion channel family protein n=2 Tax=Pseudooceanicola sediminis TaxID=2211117 RepID=A0A399J906_9RHOB|nr:mechanosensitive ion channel family protein [Puniceibacterium sp. HSS470]RII40502.1 mechanosensitive ion channel family protein [Pseudooceanicola sediminis]|tara:strand:+ start:96709 stop:99300 length:2592 start_codon:yes stop_codon:yes gene_type:complete